MSETVDNARERLLQAAEALFAERGYQRSSTRAIAGRAGVNEVTLFRIFGSKLQLLQAVIDNAAPAGLSTLQTNQPGGEYRADLLRLAHDEVANAQARRRLVRLLLCEAIHLPELHAAVVAGAQRNRIQLGNYFRDRIAAGAVRAELDPHVLAEAFFSLTSSYVLQATLLDTPDDAGQPLEQLIEQFVGIFVRGTAATRE